MHFLCVSTLVSQICISVFTREGGPFLTSLLTEIRSTSLRKKIINLRNCIDLEKDHFLCVVSSFCVWVQRGSPLLTTAVQGLTEVSKQRAQECAWKQREERRQREWERGGDFFASWWAE